MIDPLGLDSLYFDGYYVYWIDSNGLSTKKYSAKSGPYGNGSLPAGSYTGNNLRTRTHEGMNCPDSETDDSPDGWSLDLNPNFVTTRTLLRIHPDGNVDGTLRIVSTCKVDLNPMFKKPGD